MILFFLQDDKRTKIARSTHWVRVKNNQGDTGRSFVARRRKASVLHDRKMLHSASNRMIPVSLNLTLSRMKNIQLQRNSLNATAFGMLLADSMVVSGLACWEAATPKMVSASHSASSEDLAEEEYAVVSGFGSSDSVAKP